MTQHITEQLDRTTIHICPSCGFNFQRDKLLKSGEWFLDPRGKIMYGTEIVRISPAQKVVLHSLAQAYPRGLTLQVLSNRFSDTQNPNNASVHISRIRSACKSMGIEVPFYSEGGRGGKNIAIFYWKYPVETLELSNG